MGQELSDIPKSKTETERHKGPIPLAGILLAFGLLAVFILFFFPALFGFGD